MYTIMSFFSCLVLSDSLQPHGLQHARLPVLHCLPEFAQILKNGNKAYKQHREKTKIAQSLVNHAIT